MDFRVERHFIIRRVKQIHTVSFQRPSLLHLVPQEKHVAFQSEYLEFPAFQEIVVKICFVVAEQQEFVLNIILRHILEKVEQHPAYPSEVTREFPAINADFHVTSFMPFSYFFMACISIAIPRFRFVKANITKERESINLSAQRERPVSTVSFFISNPVFSRRLRSDFEEKKLTCNSLSPSVNSRI